MRSVVFPCEEQSSAQNDPSIEVSVLNELREWRNGTQIMQKICNLRIDIYYIQGGWEGPLTN